MLKEMLEARKVPLLKSREEMLDIMQREVYGFIPDKPQKISFEKKEEISNFCCGKAVFNKITANCVINGREFSFPFYETLINDGKKHPFFVAINFRDSVPDMYMPIDEIVDGGFSVLSFCYKDITNDDGDFTDGLAKLLYSDGERGSGDCGKIAMWAWAAHRVMDYAEQNPEIFDLERATVCGHSRLGKTALLAGATDTRFKFVYSNDSGCSGAAITREKQGERVGVITNVFPFWFCKNYAKYSEKEDTMPFDQHYLAASVAPRCLLIGSASEDIWADPMSELLTCVAASPAFDGGFKYEDREPQIDDKFFDGKIGYHLRGGTHYFGRTDWQRIMEFVNIHSK